MPITPEKIYTSRLILRRVEEDDLPQLVEWSRSPEACGNFLSPEEYHLDQLQQQLVSGSLWSEQEKIYIIELKGTGEALGLIHFWSNSAGEGTRTMALKIVSPEQRNHGYGTEAQKFLIMQLFERSRVKRVEMYTDINNIPQQRCLTRLGFVLVESLNYDDKNVKRVGHLYRLKKENYLSTLLYHFHYE